MSIGLLFWIVFIIAVLFSGYHGRTGWPGWFGGAFIYFILIFLLGWGIFGFVIHR
jgi:uncharacterized membrane protein YhdT